jgi:hypothetical protein
MTAHDCSSRTPASPLRRPGVARSIIPAFAAALAATPAYAGVEYVTPTSNCTLKVDVPGGKPLRIIAGQNIQFEVWGNSVDLADPTNGFRINISSGPTGGVSASVISRRSGPSNLSRGCGNVGSAVVRVNSPPTLASQVVMTIQFRMPFGDWSSQPVTINPFPAITSTWTSLPGSCLIKTGSAEMLNNSTTMVVQLPPGHRQDQTNCSTRITARLRDTFGDLDITGPAITYNVSGLPNFLTAVQLSGGNPGINLNIDIARIRALTGVSNSNITFTNPLNTARTTTLRLEVRPELGQGFASTATANPTTLTAGDPVDFTVRLSAPAAANQVITWRMTSPGCFIEANPQSQYNPSAPFQHFVFPQGQQNAIIRVRSRTGTGCTNVNSLVAHIFEAWIGDSRTNPQVTAVTSGPTYTRATIQLRDPNAN